MWQVAFGVFKEKTEQENEGAATRGIGELAIHFLKIKTKSNIQL